MLSRITRRARTTTPVANPAQLKAEILGAMESGNFPAVEAAVLRNAKGRNGTYKRIVREALRNYCNMCGPGYYQSRRVHTELTAAIDLFLGQKQGSSKEPALRAIRDILNDRGVPPPDRWGGSIQAPAANIPANPFVLLPPSEPVIQLANENVDAGTHPLLAPNADGWPELSPEDFNRLDPNEECPITIENVAGILAEGGQPVVVKNEETGVLHLFDFVALKDTYAMNPQNPVNRQPIAPGDCFRVPVKHEVAEESDASADAVGRWLTLEKLPIDENFRELIRDALEAAEKKNERPDASVVSQLLDPTLTENSNYRHLLAVELINALYTAGADDQVDEAYRHLLGTNLG